MANALPRLGSFILLPIYTRFMDPSGLGVVSLMISLATLLSIIFRLGQEPALLRLHFDYDPPERGRLYWSALVVTTVTGTLSATVLTAFLAGRFDELFAGVSWTPYGIVALGIALGNSLMFIPLAWLRAEEQVGRYAAFTTLVFGTIAATTLLLIVALDLDALGALLGQAVGAALVAIFAVAMVLRMRASDRFKDASEARALLAFGLPLMPHAISVWVLGVSDRWLIGALSSGGAAEAQAQIGVYWLGYQLASGISLLAAAVQAAWIPTLFRHGHTPAGADAYGAITTVTALGFVGLAAMLGIFAPEIIGLVGTEEYSGAIPILRISVFAALGYAIYMMTVGAVMLTRRTRPLAVITTVSAALNVLLNVVLIPNFGIIGAAWASVIGYAAYAVLTILYTRQVFDGRIHSARVLTGVGAAAVGVTAASQLGGLQPIVVRLIAEIALFACVTFAVAWLGRRPFATLATAIGELEDGAGRQSNMFH